MMTSPAMHILIPTHGRAALLGRTLESIAAASLPDSLRHVWVIENGEACGAERICAGVRGLPLQYVHRAQPGKSRALQWAVEQIGDGLAVFFDDDVRIAEAALRAYDQAAATHGRGHFFGGPLPIDYETPPADWLKPHLPTSVMGWEPMHFEHRTEDGACFLGANMAMFVNDILDAGGFNAEVGPGAKTAGTFGNPVGQETQMQERLLARGARPIFLPEARVWHYVPAERCSPRWALHWQFRGCLTDAIKHPPTRPPVMWGALPRWLWVQLALAAPRAAASCLMPSAQRRFAMRQPWHRYRGYAVGWKMRTAKAA